MEFNTLTIEEATECLIDYRGKTPPKTDSGVRLVTAKVVKGGQIHDEPAEYIDAEFYDEWMRRGLPKKLDVLLTTEAPLGEVAILRTEARIALAQRIILLRARPGILDPLYLFYALQSDFGQGELKARASGTTVLGIKQSELRKVRIPVCPLPIQQRIAGILSAYDELIDNSQRRIKILEAMARALYREWFVHFRFPDHESVPRVPSPFGKIPKGWEIMKLFELTKVNYGKNLPTKKLTDDGSFPVYGAAKVIGRYTEYTREHRTIICGCRGSVGEMQITQPQCYVTNNSFAFDPVQPDSYFWLFHALKERGLRDVVGGAAQPQITLEGISSVELVTPPLTLRSRFQQVVLSMFQQAWVLDAKTQNLRRTRDLLLPRLLSGQIDVESLL